MQEYSFSWLSIKDRYVFSSFFIVEVIGRMSDIWPDGVGGARLVPRRIPREADKEPIVPRYLERGNFE